MGHFGCYPSGSNPNSRGELRFNVDFGKNNPYDFRFCATDKRSAITGGNACRPDRPRKAVKRPGYTGFVPDRPGSDNLMGRYWSFRVSVSAQTWKAPGLKIHPGSDQLGVFVTSGPLRTIPVGRKSAAGGRTSVLRRDVQCWKWRLETRATRCTT